MALRIGARIVGQIEHRKRGEGWGRLFGIGAHPLEARLWRVPAVDEREQLCRISDAGHGLWNVAAPGSGRSSKASKGGNRDSQGRGNGRGGYGDLAGGVDWGASNGRPEGFGFE